MSSDSATDRTRTITWHDPMLSATAARGMSGLQMLQALIAGELPPPPIFALMGMALTEVSDGRAVFTMVPAEYHYNPIGSVHGGIAATLLDSAMGCSVNSLLPAGVTYTTLEIKVNYIRPLTTSTGIVRCEGKVLHLGGKTATAEATLRNVDGKLLAHATTTCLIFRS